MDKIEIKMLESMKGRDDDEIQTKLFKKGETYFVGESLAHVFIKQMKVAKEVITPVEENKTVQVPENKTVGTSECQDNVTVPAKKPAVKKTVRKKATKRTKK